jgi:hypothetical protein
MAIIKDAIQSMENVMKPEVVAQAKREAHEEILRIRLAELRETYGVHQVDVKGFTQPAVSKLEKRKDIKLSTLLDYLDALGLKIEIKVAPKVHKTGTPKELIILRD